MNNVSFFFFFNFCVQSGSERVRTGSGRPDSWPSQIFTWQESAVGSVNSSASTTARQTPGFSIASCFIDKRNSGKKQSVNSFLWLNYCTPRPGYRYAVCFRNWPNLTAWCEMLQTAVRRTNLAFLNLPHRQHTGYWHKLLGAVARQREQGSPYRFSNWKKKRGAGGS